MDRDANEHERDEVPPEERRSPSDRREENRRGHPRYTPGGTKAPDRRNGDRRTGDDPVG